MKTIDELIDYVARTESGGRYDAWNPDDNGAGVSFGLIQFNQRKGSLPELLRRMHEADPDAFHNIFDIHATLLVGELADHLPREGTDLTGLEPLFREAGAYPSFQQVQRDLARELYFDPALKAARHYDIGTERAVAMIFDTAVQRGVGGMRKILDEAVGIPPHAGSSKSDADWNIILWFAELADRGLGGENGRRHRILRDPELSDEPFNPELPGTTMTVCSPSGACSPETAEALKDLKQAAEKAMARPTLKLGDRGDAVIELQRRLKDDHLAMPLNIDGVFGQITHGYVEWFQASKGLVVDGIVGPKTWSELLHREEGG